MAQAQETAEHAVTTSSSSRESKALVNVEVEGGMISLEWQESCQDLHHERILPTPKCHLNAQSALNCRIL